MKQLIIALVLSFTIPLCHAWNAAGHRLSAVIAWQVLSAHSQDRINEILSKHPEYERWVEKAKSSEAQAIFAEASTWPDDIRNDSRFHDEIRSSSNVTGLVDSSRHKNWHYVDLGSDGSTKEGLVDKQIGTLSKMLRSTANEAEISYALPWLIHLVADIHQPLHVGRHGDEGGNLIEIENPFNRRLPFSSLHTYWDDLPGPPWLRGKRLMQKAAGLLDTYKAPPQALVRDWRDESHRLLSQAYPKANGSLLPIITDDFHRQAHELANQRIVDSGYRLGRLLEEIFTTGVSRGTP